VFWVGTSCWLLFVVCFGEFEVVLVSFLWLWQGVFVVCALVGWGCGGWGGWAWWKCFVFFLFFVVGLYMYRFLFLLYKFLYYFYFFYWAVFVWCGILLDMLCMVLLVKICGVFYGGR